MTLRRNLLRSQDTHKGDYGHALVLAGSPRMTGAAYLTAQTALLGGSGKVTLGLPRGIHSILARKLTEVMTLPLPQTPEGSLSRAGERSILKFARRVDAVMLGPGLTTHASTRALVIRLLKKITKPLIVDADGLNCLRGHLNLLRQVKAPLILTPHEGELSRLLGKRRAMGPDEREGVAKWFSSHYHCILVLKGHRTLVVSAGKKPYVNPSGNPGMATAGSGDVLTGLIGSFVGQGFDPFFAASLAVYAHGLAGDRAAKHVGQTSLKATDLLTFLPQAMKSLERKRDLRHVLRLS